MLRRPRLSIDISADLHERMSRLIPWGVQSLVMRTLLSRALDIVDQYGELGLGAIIAGRITIIDLLRKKEEQAK